MKTVIQGFVIGVIIVAISYGGWQLKRWWNYNWGYESQVTQTVCDMVKPEYLKQPNNCK